jgi:hypothetical protein
VNIDWLIPCRYVEVHDNLGTIVGAGIDTFWLPDLPAPLQVAIAVRLQGLPDELTPDVMHPLRQIIRGPDGETVSEMSGEAAFGAQQEIARPDWLQGVLLPVVVGFEVEAEGTYTFEFMIDDSSASVPLHVVHGVPGAPAEGDPPASEGST